MSAMTAKLQGLLDWADERFPLTSGWKAHLSEYYAPKNFNFWYFFGSLALLVLVNQIVTGIFLTMHYKPDASLNASGVPVAFASGIAGKMFREFGITVALAVLISLFEAFTLAPMLSAYFARYEKKKKTAVHPWDKLAGRVGSLYVLQKRKIQRNLRLLQRGCGSDEEDI